MEKFKFITITALLSGLFLIAICLDKQGCKSPTEVFDILGGGKIQDLELQNNALREENRILRSKIKIMQSKIDEMARIERENEDNFIPVGRSVSTPPPPKMVHNSLQPIDDDKYFRKIESNNTGYKKSNHISSTQNMPSYYDYQRKIFPKFQNIHSEWRKSTNPQSGDKVSIIVTIGRNGKIISKEIENSNVSTTSERFLLDKMSKLPPFEPLPSDYTKSTITYRVTFQSNLFGMGTYHKRLD